MTALLETLFKPKGFILTDFYILGLPTGIGAMNKVSNLVFKEVMGDRCI